mmetsp:Transcript_39918/g.120187  ORF Transcript_39918/g.120187 Transcript_39918/m.120187 type:complete len:236 (+) Transcript_39918:1777-2484(+)
MEPIGGKIQRIAGLHDDLVRASVPELREFVQIGIRPIDGRMSRGRMSLGKQCEIFAFVRMTEDVATFAPEEGDGIPRAVEMVLGDDPLHPETAVYALLTIRFDDVEVLVLRLEVGYLVEEIFGRIPVAVPHLAASDEAVVPVRIVRTELIVGGVGVLEPFGVFHAYELGGWSPSLRLLDPGRLPLTSSSSSPLLLILLRIHPVHEMIVRAVFGAVRYRPQHAFHVSRLIPTFGRT